MKTSYLQAIPKPDAPEKNRPLCENPLQPLALGEIECTEGWLRTQLELMAEGITGRLPEFGPFFRPEENGFLYPDTQKGWEEVPYWLRGFYPLAVLVGHEALLKTAQEYIEAIFSSAQEDGWFGPAYLKEYEKTADGLPLPDLFPNMLLIDTLMLHYSHSKDPRVLALFEKYTRFCLSLTEAQFLPALNKSRLRWQKIRAGDMLEPLYWYYRETKDEAALELAARFHGGISKSCCGFISAHAVNFAQRFAYDAIYSQQSGRQEHFDRSEFEYAKFQMVWGQMPRGIFAADEQTRLGAIDPSSAFEPCGMVELAKNYYILGRISGRTCYADKTEDVMLNHFAPSFTPDYKQMHYLTAANSPIQSNDLYASTYNGSKSHDRSFQIMTPNNRCCGHNTGMGWPWYVMNLWQKTADGGLAALMYAPCRVRTQIDGQPVELTVNTEYPFKETVDISVSAEGTFPIYFRIPQWCKNAVFRVNGEPVQQEATGGGWLRIHRTWKANDAVSIAFPMEISLTRWPANGSVSVDRGPFTYSVRIKEEYRVVEDALAYNHPEPHLWENYEILPTSAWNYGLVLDEGDEVSSISVLSIVPEIEKQPFTEAASPVVLKARARRIPEWQLQDSCAADLQQGPIHSDEAEEIIEMIPLGCARLRMSCLPVLTDDPLAPGWKKAPEHIPCDQREKPFTAHYHWSDIAYYPD